MSPGNQGGDLKLWLESQTSKFNRPEFIAYDPIQIPHRYVRSQDIEITAFWTAVLAWGQRKTIIAKATELFSMMGDSPYEFMVNHTEKDRIPFQTFRHRTFQATDTLYFLDFFQRYYRQHSSLEDAFLAGHQTMEKVLSTFHDRFFNSPLAPARTRKHLPTPVRGSTCKRLNMFLRWLVRQDGRGVDFGLWRRIRPSQLMIPLDVHVDRVARKLGLIERKQTDWLTVEELTARLRQYDPQDPVKYDFALFGSSAAPF